MYAFMFTYVYVYVCIYIYIYIYIWPWSTRRGLPPFASAGLAGELTGRPNT